MTSQTTPDAHDPFFFDHEALQHIASQTAIHQGLIFSKKTA